MRIFLLSLFVAANIIWYDFSTTINAIYIWFTNLILKVLIAIKNEVKSVFRSLRKFIKLITWPFRKALYEYMIVAFITCMFVSNKYPNWIYADYVWVLFFVVMMATLAVVSIRDK